MELADAGSYFYGNFRREKQMDLSTIGVKFGWAVEKTAGEKPTAFKWIKRCNKIAGLNITKDKLDTTCFEDKIKTYIAGVGDTGGDWNINFNGTKKGSAIDTVKAWNELLEKSEAGAEEGKATWADIFIPGFGSYFVKFEPGEIPLPDLEPNSKLDIQIANVVNEYIGLNEAIEPTETVS